MKKSLIGLKFGRLTVQSIDSVGTNNKTHYLCQCECGNTTKVTASNLGAGKVKSCGCWRRDFNAKKRKAPGIAALNALYHSYRKRALEKLQITFDLTIEKFTEITQQPCFYCGIEPSNTYKRDSKSYGSYIYNGVDRLDNTQGYVENNVVACCKVCNYAKRTQTLAQFYTWVRRVYHHTSSISKETS